MDGSRSRSRNTSTLAIIRWCATWMVRFYVDLDFAELVGCLSVYLRGASDVFGCDLESETSGDNTIFI
eukprot:CAMPEP_0115038358 /NCGR_PEP_ID=MMETSP0216-20121206/43361_1 /TAXON_ID=223996 /ORGANISM="Protocruzia adherens, Strain Boccale" /LENGTH=67 /DNA_ID=CAMNT_0002418743 /DNA_START=95 /DNA_END=298 /DNA_ORIENTATION=+